MAGEYTAESPRGVVTYYLHDLGATPDVSGDQIAKRYYYNTTAVGAETSFPSGYVTVHNVILDTPGVAAGSYIL